MVEYLVCDIFQIEISKTPWIISGANTHTSAQMYKICTSYAEMQAKFTLVRWKITRNWWNNSFWREFHSRLFPSNEEIQYQSDISTRIQNIFLFSVFTFIFLSSNLFIFSASKTKGKYCIWSKNKYQLSTSCYVLDLRVNENMPPAILFSFLINSFQILKKKV